MESVEDGNTVLVAGGQYGTGNRYMVYFIGRSIRAFSKSRNRNERFPMNGSLTHIRA